MTFTRSKLLHRLRLLPIIAVLIGAAFIRIYHLASVPPGVASDSALTLADALRISHGYAYPATFGTEPEPLYRYVLAGWMLLVGPSEVTAMILQTLIALLTVALTYRAGFVLLRDWQWRHSGAVVAAGALAALTPHVFLSRNIYRIILMPPIVLIAFIALLDASRTGRKTAWAVGGFCAGLCLHIYPAGLVAPFWVIGFIIHQWITSRRQRQQWQQALWALVGMISPVGVWFILNKLVPDLYGPTMGWSGATNALQSIIDGFNGAVQAYFLVGHHLPNFNAPNTPFLNPPLAILALIGIGLALIRFYKADGALFLGGLILFTIPGALTSDKTYPLRYAGCMPLLALLAGWGASAAASLISKPLMLRRYIQPLIAVAAAVLIVGSLAVTHIAYQGTFSDPSRYADPRNWTSVPHNYSLAFENAMKYLSKVDQPTYLPMWLLDNPISQYFLQREAYPKVMTWARYGLKELPEGQFFMPAFWMYHMAADDTSTARVLLLPAEKTIVLLPGLGLPDSISGAPPTDDDPGVTTIQDPMGWELGRTRPVPRSAFDAPPVPSLDALPTLGSGLRLLSMQPTTPIQPGKPVRVLVQWLVTAPQPADIFSVVQLLKPDFSAVAGSAEHHVMFYLYPSAMWQPGDIIPDWHEITLSETMPDGIYRWGAGVYIPPNGKRLSIASPSGDWGPQLPDLWLSDAIRFPAVTPSNRPLPAEAIPTVGSVGAQIHLEGYQLKQNVENWTLSLYWRSTQQPAGDYTIFIHGEHEGKLVAQHDEKPVDLPSWAWLPGELVVTSYTLPITEPPDTLYVGMYSYPSLERLPIMQDGKQREDRRFVLWRSADEK